MKKIVKRIVIVLVVILAVLGIYALYLILAYYRLPDELTLEVNKNGRESDSATDDSDEDIKSVQGGSDGEFRVRQDSVYRIMTYNIGFGAYLPDFSFFMDGGKSSWAKDEESVLATISAVGETVSGMNPDFILLQEIDRDGTRSYHVDELEILNRFFQGYYYDFAQNYDSPYLLFPLWEPHGTNVAGLATYSRGEIQDSVRRSLPVSESLSKFMDLDRCYSISRIPVENGRLLCIYNIHMSAYGSNDALREGQLAMLYQDMTADYTAGNYVICGGDYNHNVKEEAAVDAPEWAYPFPRETIPEGFRMALDDAADADAVAHNSCRNANEPYQEGHTFTITLDGFIVSDNVKVADYQHVDLGYAYSDHDPVLMEFILE